MVNNNPHTPSLIHGFSSPCLTIHTSLHAQASASGLDELEVEHRKLSQLADKAKALRAQNAQMAGEVANLPELKKAAADLQQQVVQMQHVRQQIQRLQVCGAVWVCLAVSSRHAAAHVSVSVGLLSSRNCL